MSARNFAVIIFSLCWTALAFAAELPVNSGRAPVRVIEGAEARELVVSWSEAETWPGATNILTRAQVKGVLEIPEEEILAISIYEYAREPYEKFQSYILELVIDRSCSHETLQLPVQISLDGVLAGSFFELVSTRKICQPYPAMSGGTKLVGPE